MGNPLDLSFFSSFGAVDFDSGQSTEFEFHRVAVHRVVIAGAIGRRS